MMDSTELIEEIPCHNIASRAATGVVATRSMTGSCRFSYQLRVWNASAVNESLDETLDGRTTLPQEFVDLVPYSGSTLHGKHTCISFYLIRKSLRFIHIYGPNQAPVFDGCYGKYDIKQRGIDCDLPLRTHAYACNRAIEQDRRKRTPRRRRRS